MEVEDYASSSGGTSNSEDEQLCDYSGDLSNLQSSKEIVEAIWKDELGMAEIVSYEGSLSTSIGIVRHGKTYYSMEETLFMAEAGALHLVRDDLCLSLQEINKMVSQGKSGCCWESFEVYRHLKSLGYIIGRHGVPWTLRRLIRNESKSVEAKEEINVKSNREYEDKSTIMEMFKDMYIERVKPVFDVYLPNSKFKKSSPGNPSFVLCLTGSLPPSKQEIINLERQCHGVYYMSDVPALSRGPYFTVVLSSIASMLLLSVKACVFSVNSQIEAEASLSLSKRKLHLKKSWGMPILFLSSVVFALEHIVVALFYWPMI